MTTKRITAIPRTEVRGINVPWSLSGKNHEGVPTTWTRIQEQGQTGPIGQYWKTGADGSFDKSVWVIEDSTPISPTNVFLQSPTREQELIATTSAKLQVRFTTNTGEQVNGWDAYEDNIVLGETLTHYVMAVEFDGFRWAEWGNYDESFQQAFGTGANNAVPKDGNLLLGWRLNTKNSPTVSPTANPWNPIKNLGAFDIESQAMFAVNEAFERRLEDAQGKNYWLIPKSVVSEAILVTEEQSVLGYNKPNINPTQVLELTWMSPLTKDPVLEGIPKCRINFVQDGATISDILNRKDMAGSVTYTEAKGSRPAQVKIDFSGISAALAKTALGSLPTQTGSYRGATYFGKVHSASYVIGDSPNVKTSTRGVGFGSSVRVSNYMLKEVGVFYKDGSPQKIGSVPTVGAPWPGGVGYASSGMSSGLSIPNDNKPRGTWTNVGGTRVYNARVTPAVRNTINTTTVSQAPVRTAVGTLTINLDAIRYPPVKENKGNVRFIDIVVQGERAVIMAK